MTEGRRMDPRWQCQPALPASDRASLVAAAFDIQRRIPPKRGRQLELDELARAYGVTLRTLQRYMRAAVLSTQSGDDEPAPRRAA